MQKITIFPFILPFLCGLPFINADHSKTSLAHDWVFVSDFQPNELANLTSQEEHQLLLKSLLKRKSKGAEGILLWELLGKAVGIEFCRITEDESTNREHMATVKALFECAAKLQFQKQSASALLNVQGTDHLKEPSDFVKAFSSICSKIDRTLENITFYTERRDHYRKMDSWQPKKTYFYSIPKNEDDFRKQLTNFANEPEVKKVHPLLVFVWAYISAEKEWPGKQVLMHLSQVPGKLEVAQKILDELIIEMVPEINDVSHDQIGLTKELGRSFNKIAIALNKKLKEKIYANADIMQLVTKWQSPDSPDYIPGLSKKV